MNKEGKKGREKSNVYTDDEGKVQIARKRDREDANTPKRIPRIKNANTPEARGAETRGI